MIKHFLVLVLLLVAINLCSQTRYENKSKDYSFAIPSQYEVQSSNHPRNEYVFVNKRDTTSLVVNVNERPYNKESLQAFKEESNSNIEKKYFGVLQNPRIVQRGELSRYRDRTIFFHVKHTVSSVLENDYMLTYLFYNKGKEINFIFRTKERRLEKVIPSIQDIVDSVLLID